MNKTEAKMIMLKIKIALKMHEEKIKDLPDKEKNFAIVKIAEDLFEIYEPLLPEGNKEFLNKVLDECWDEVKDDPYFAKTKKPRWILFPYMIPSTAIAGYLRWTDVIFPSEMMCNIDPSDEENVTRLKDVIFHELTHIPQNEDEMTSETERALCERAGINYDEAHSTKFWDQVEKHDSLGVKRNKIAEERRAAIKAALEGKINPLRTGKRY